MSTSDSATLTKLPFPPITKSHIMNCSFHSWYPRYRSVTPKTRLIALPRTFIDYLRADGIFLPPDESSQQRNAWSDTDSGIFSSAENDDAQTDDAADDDDPSVEWPQVHDAIRSTLQEFAGKGVMPKLNWSAPKDATWIAADNSMKCTTPNDVYLLLKSSDFVTHDLENVFDDTDPASPPTGHETTEDFTYDTIPYHLILRKYFLINPSLEFRCFVRRRTLLCMCQRDLNHFEHLFPDVPAFTEIIQKFFDTKLRDSFPDENFVFDVYVPPPKDRVWLIDVNPWAPRTDPLLFSWLEILTMPQPEVEQTIWLSIGHATASMAGTSINSRGTPIEPGSDVSSDEEDIFTPELRLVHKDDPEAYAFSSPQYSAHKLPRDVVDAAATAQSDGGGLREFAAQWKDALERKQREEALGVESSDDEV
ncbi:D123-domain-containing protein [Pseudovirgaria hyperparasitica]|uniref:D123-domain-containing protein n=1 Tax=Pseudovirgaria hyperparasitica TaxID=470096 RepID=A0A6A6VXA6_9PEZI|nr:D123-domain-containing protein [Pseudovirgaria hyperparasitica]KAF2755298.1 D123-domain-containing protein [Pseudovirgaria hyperparasitica]